MELPEFWKNYTLSNLDDLLRSKDAQTRERAAAEIKRRQDHRAKVIAEREANGAERKA